MRRTYIVGHWGLTLLLAPFTSQVLHYAFLPSPHQVAGLLEVYPITNAPAIMYIFCDP